MVLRSIFTSCEIFIERIVLTRGRTIASFCSAPLGAWELFPRLPRAARCRRGRRHRFAPGSIVPARWAGRVAETSFTGDTMDDVRLHQQMRSRLGGRFHLSTRRDRCLSLEGHYNYKSVYAPGGVESTGSGPESACRAEQNRPLFCPVRPQTGQK